MERLVESGIEYRIAYVSETALGQQAAILADLAVAPMPVSMVTPQFEVLCARMGLPDLPTYQINLVQPKEISAASKAFAQHVRDGFVAL